MDDDDLELFRHSIRHATDNHTGEALDAALDDLGWRDALAAAPRVSASVLFELQGAANATSSALDDLLAATLGGGGGTRVGVVLPAAGRWDPPGDLAGGVLRVRGLGSATLARHPEAIVVTAGDLRVVPTDALGLRPVQGMDPSLGIVAVTADLAPDAAPVTLPSPEWSAAVALAQRALGHELAGAARAMLELAREHAMTRVQFGRPISMFQAVRHRLAECLVAVEMAEATLAAAWDDPSPEVAAMAKALAGRGARTAARHCQQVLAGIGFTTEHGFHRYLRRILVLDQLFGSARSLTRDLGERIVASRRLPHLLPL
jgi:hypothetical protein